MDTKIKRDLLMTAAFVAILLSSLAYFSIALAVLRQANRSLRVEARELHRGAREERATIKAELDEILKAVKATDHP